ncbi:MAG: V-ATPase V1 sector subunit E [Watsoniomyces obsoletus]|nr:MAG: V-ATPase V1 sector subunit E [Watsoniomyces obsoletus]
MLIDGEKWACEACVRGHRVSNCQHADRPLLHINKKGRPVSQCPHCRAVRKSRSAHVRCECGDKSQAKTRYPPLDPNNPRPAGQRPLCCCNQGGKCTCALKREQVLEGGINKTSRRTATRPRRSMTAPDAPRNVSGHLKPSAAGLPCGSPYPMSRLRAPSLHDPRRSMGDMSSAATSAADGISSGPSPLTITIAPPADPRRVQSEHGSPHMSVSPDVDRHGRSALPPLDLSFSNFHSSPAGGRPSSTYDLPGGANSGAWTPTSVVDPYFCATPDSERAMFSAGLEPPSVDWSAFDLPGGAGGYPSSASHGPRPSYGSFDLNPAVGHGGYAASTAASDADDLAALGLPSPLHPPSLVFHFPSDTSEACESDSYRLSSSSSMHGLPQLSLLASSNLDAMGMDEFLAGTATPLSPTDAVSEAGSATAFGPYHSPMMHEPNKLAPTSAPAAHEKRYSLPVTAESLHPLWGAPPTSMDDPSSGVGPSVIHMRHHSTPISLEPDGRHGEGVWAN